MAATRTTLGPISPAAVRVGARIQDLVSLKTPISQRPVMIGGGDTGIPQKMFTVSWRVKEFKGFSSPEPVLFGINLESAVSGHEQGVKRTPQVLAALQRPVDSIRDEAIDNLRSVLDFPASSLTGEPQLFPLFWSGNYTDIDSSAYDLFGRTYDCVIGLSTGPSIGFKRKDYMEVPHAGAILSESAYNLWLAKFTPRKNGSWPVIRDFSIIVAGEDLIRIGFNLETGKPGPAGESALKIVRGYLESDLEKGHPLLLHRHECLPLEDSGGFDMLFDCRPRPVR